MQTIKIRLRKEDSANLYFDMREYAEESLRNQLAVLRFEYMYLIKKKQWFNGSSDIEPHQSVLFAKLYRAMGLNTKPVRRLNQLQKEYIGKVNKIWRSYYVCLAHGVFESDAYYNEFKKKVLMQGNCRIAMRLLELYLSGNLNTVKPKHSNQFVKSAISEIKSANTELLMEILDEYITSKCTIHMQWAILSIVSGHDQRRNQS